MLPSGGVFSLDEERDQDGLIGLLQQAQQHTVHYPKLPSLLYSHGWNGKLKNQWQIQCQFPHVSWKKIIDLEQFFIFPIGPPPFLNSGSAPGSMISITF